MSQIENVPTKIFFTKEIIEGIALAYQKKKRGKPTYTSGKLEYDFEQLIGELKRLNDKKQLFNSDFSDFPQDKNYNTLKRALCKHADFFIFLGAAGKDAPLPNLLCQYGFKKTLDQVRKKFKLTWEEIDYDNPEKKHPFDEINFEKKKDSDVYDLQDQSVSPDSLQENKYLQKIKEYYSWTFLYPALEKETKISIEEMIHIGLHSRRDIRGSESLSLDLGAAKKGVMLLNEDSVEPIRKMLSEQNKTKIENTEKPKSKYEIINHIAELKKVLLVGEAGAGKTTTSKWITFHLAGLFLEGNVEFGIPVFIDLSLHYKGKLIDAIRYQMERFDYLFENSSVDVLLKNNKIVLILDGFDELQIKDYRGKLWEDVKIILEDCSLVKIILTSRESEGYLAQFIKEGFADFQLNALSKYQIEDFLEKYLTKEDANSLLNDLKDKALDAEIKNPLLLTFIASQFRKNKELNVFKSKGLLFRSVVSDFFLKQWERTIKEIKEEENIGIKITDIQEVVCSVGYEMLMQNRTSLSKEDVELIIRRTFIFNEPKEKPYVICDYILNRLIESNLFKEEEHAIGFAIKSYRDYFAAEYLNKYYDTWSKNKTNQKKLIRFFATKICEEAFVMFIGLTTNPEKIIEKLIPSKRYYYFNFRRNRYDKLKIAARCIGEVKDIDKAINQKVVARIFSLGTEKSPRTFIEFLMLLFKVGGSYFDGYEKKIELLGCTRTQEALNYFLKQTKREYGSDRVWYVLEKYPITEDIFSVYLELLRKKPRSRYDHSINNHLGENITILVVNKFLDLLKSNNMDDVVIALKFFEQLHPIKKLIKEDSRKVVIETIMDLYLVTNDSKIKGRIENITNLKYSYGEPYMRPYLYRKIADENPLVRQVAIEAMTKFIYVNQGDCDLIIERLLDDENVDVKRQALFNLTFYNLSGEIKSKEIYECAMTYLKAQGDSWERYLAFEVIQNLKLGEVIFNEMKQLTINETFLLPKAAAISLCLSIAPEFINVICENKWEELYFPYLLIDDEKLSSTDIMLSCIARFGGKSSIDFLNQFTNQNKLHPNFPRITVRIDETKKQLEQNVKTIWKDL